MAAQSASSVVWVTSLRCASNAGANLFDPLLQLRKMRPWPVYLFAVGAATELVVVDFGKRLKFLDDVRLGYFFQGGITRQTARERRDQFRKVKTADDLDRLFVRILGTRVISVLNDRVHEETSITRQERSIFARHHVEELPVIGVLVITDVKSEETKIACKSPQMSISNKS